MKILLEVFARVLHLSCEGACVFCYDLEDFEYPENESPLTASHLLQTMITLLCEERESEVLHSHRPSSHQNHFLQSPSQIRRVLSC